ncbi:hypothetical protein BVRB_2g044060 [Beta vulgaris subsp. vulgaris]|nr:hypothetical protein BVRB_2g044060 [Beta vulgaris subsp. vulgaris]
MFQFQRRGLSSMLVRPAPHLCIDVSKGQMALVESPYLLSVLKPDK